MIYFLIMYFECAYCNIQLKTKYNLARHIKVTHFTGIEKNNPQLKITSHNFASLQGKYKSQELADHAIVFMIRGIKKKFKQPVAFSFCQGATQQHKLVRQLKEVS